MRLLSPSLHPFRGGLSSGNPPGVLAGIHRVEHRPQTRALHQVSNQGRKGSGDSIRAPVRHCPDQYGEQCERPDNPPYEPIKMRPIPTPSQDRSSGL